MAKHNIDAIAHVCYAADEAHTNPEAPPCAWGELDEQIQRHWKTLVLHAIHDEDPPSVNGSEAPSRRDRLFADVVKALTVRL